MDKQTFIQKAGSQAALAKVLGISQAAVSQWKNVPELRLLQLKASKPEWFEVDSSLISESAARAV